MLKKVLIGTGVTLFIVAAVFFLGCPQADKPKAIDPANVVKKTVNMSGMTCEACEIAIERVGSDTGVANIKASSPDQRVEVEFDKTQTDIKTIMKAIEMKGFTPLSYEDEMGLHELNSTKTQAATHEMKCGAGKCGGK